MSPSNILSTKKSCQIFKCHECGKGLHHQKLENYYCGKYSAYGQVQWECLFGGRRLLPPPNSFHCPWSWSMTQLFGAGLITGTRKLPYFWDCQEPMLRLTLGYQNHVGFWHYIAGVKENSWMAISAWESRLQRRELNLKCSSQTRTSRHGHLKYKMPISWGSCLTRVFEI